MNPTTAASDESPSPRTGSENDGPSSRTRQEPGLKLSRPRAGVLVVELAGDWLMRAGLPSLESLETELNGGPETQRLEFDVSRLGGWDSGLVSFVLKCQECCERRHVPFADETLPSGLRKLMRLARVAPVTKAARREKDHRPWLQRLGELGIQAWENACDALDFIGESVLAFGRLLRGRTQFRWSDALMVMQQCGPEALGVVALINFLVGVILAFVGSVQLRQFGAATYVADLVAIGTVREMGCIMTGVILCGRTGAAFAAQLGAMKVNEEIDAFKTFGISPIEFLVLPRIMAMLLMMPLLCVFADAIAIAGGFLIAISMLDVSSHEYLRRTVEAITLKSFLLGIFKGSFFGILVAVSGCLRGMQCGTNAAAVGRSTTSAVVTGITAIVAADGVFAVLCNALDI